MPRPPPRPSLRLSSEPPFASTPAAPDRLPERRAPLAGYALAALGAALFSTKGVLIKLAYAEGIGTETLLALRMGLAVPFYLAIGTLALRERLAVEQPLPPRAVVARAALVGVLGYWFASYVDFLGLVYISAQFERLILFTYPAFVVLFGVLFFSQPVRPGILAGVAVSYAGLALIFATKLDALGPDVAKGAGLVLAAAIAFALYQLLAKGLIGVVGPRLFTCIAMSAAAVAALVQFALTEPLSRLIVTPRLFAYALFLAIGATVLPSFLLNAALHRISAQANATIGTLSPVITILLAVAILGETFGWVDAAGTALVIAGIGWFTLAERRR
jgi:drug/metabolite transporter (DMT)-like permease